MNNFELLEDQANQATQEAENMIFKTSKQIDDFLKTLDDDFQSDEY